MLHRIYVTFSLAHWSCIVGRVWLWAWFDGWDGHSWAQWTHKHSDYMDSKHIEGDGIGAIIPGRLIEGGSFQVSIAFETCFCCIMFILEYVLALCKFSWPIIWIVQVGRSPVSLHFCNKSFRTLWFVSFLLSMIPGHFICVFLTSLYIRFYPIGWFFNQSLSDSGFLCEWTLKKTGEWGCII